MAPVQTALPGGAIILPQGITRFLCAALAASLAMFLTLDDLEWLWRDLKGRAEERRKAQGGELPVLAGCRDIWEPVRDVA